MPHRLPCLRVLAVVLALGVTATACGDDDITSTLEGPAADIHTGDCSEPRDVTVTLYSGRSEDLIEPVIEAFECASGINVATNYGDPTDLALLMSEEGDRTPADIFLSKSPGAVGFLGGQGLLQPLADDVLDSVDETDRASDGTWVGISGRQRVLVYNTDNVADDELPGSIFDLTDDAYRGRVAIPATNGSFQDWFTIFRAQMGDAAAAAWLDDMVANDAIVTESNRPTVDAVGRGEFDFGLVNHYYNFQQVEALGDSHHALNHTFGGDDIGGLLIITAAGITTNSENVDEATELIEFMLGAGAQTYFTNETLEYPLSAGVNPADVLPELESSGAFDVSFDDLGEGLARTIEIIEASGILG